MSIGAGRRLGLTARLRRAIRRHRAFFTDVRDTLGEAGVATPYDAYLARAFLVTLGALALGGLAAVAAAGLGRPTVALMAAGGGVLLAAAVLGVFLVWPSVRARSRAREIDAVMPFGLMVMNALTRAGLDAGEVIATVAAEDERYGALGEEFAAVHRDVTHYGEDLISALEAARESTPSEAFGDFLGDLVTVMASRSDLTSFMESQYRKQHDRASADQEAFLERLASFAQMYVILTFVAPIMAIVLLVLLSFSGADTLALIYVTAYVYPVIAIALATVVLGVLETRIALPALGMERTARDGPDRPDDDPALGRYLRARRWRRIRGWDPVTAVLRHPPLSLAVTVPIVAAAAAAAVWGGGIAPAAIAGDPVALTAAVAVASLVVAVPITLLYGRQRRRQKATLDAIPDGCERLAEAVDVGMTPAEACRVVADEVGGPLGDDLGRVARESRVTDDVVGALRAVARRRPIPALVMTMTTFAEAVRATDDVDETLEDLAEATSSRAALTTKRRSAMALYAVVVTLGLATFLSVAVLLDLFFLPQLSTLVTSSEAQLLGEPVIPEDGYRPILFRAALIQGILNGLFVGRLRDGRLRDGLRYSVLFVAATTAVFVALVVLVG